MSGFNERRSGTPLSRRQAIAVAATVGVGLTAGTVIGVAAAGERDKGSQDNAGESIIIRIKNASNGTLEIFTGELRIEVSDRDMTNKLLKAAKKKG